MLASPVDTSHRIEVHTAVPTLEEPEFEVAVSGALTSVYKAPVVGETAIAAHPANKAVENKQRTKYMTVFLKIHHLLRFLSGSGGGSTPARSMNILITRLR
jgi:hypothetical protein